MPEDTLVAGSLAYRKNQDAIWRGKVPDKYIRLLPHIVGNRVIEIGAAEGVLSLLMAEQGKTVLALERRQDRHQEALELQNRWRAMGRKVDGCKMVVADIVNEPERMIGFDCLVGIRVMYHLRDKAQGVIKAAALAGVKTVLLCGNRGRATRYEGGTPDEGLGPFNYYSTIKGMSELLTRASYRIDLVIKDGDPIVRGTHRSH